MKYDHLLPSSPSDPMSFQSDIFNKFKTNTSTTDLVSLFNSRIMLTLILGAFERRLVELLGYLVLDDTSVETKVLDFFA